MTSLKIQCFAKITNLLNPQDLLITVGGGGLVQQLRKSYSLSDLSECEPREERGSDEADDVLAEPRLIRRGAKSSGYGTRRSASESNSRAPMYFPEVDVDVRAARPNRTDEPDFSHIKSSEDISSGYSSADNSASLARAGSLGRRARAARTTVTPIKRPPPAEESEVIIEELRDDDSFEYANMPPLVNLPSPIYLSRTDPPFLYQYVGDQVKILQVLGNNDSINVNVNDEIKNSEHGYQTEKVTQKEMHTIFLENDDKSKQHDKTQQKCNTEINNSSTNNTVDVSNIDNNALNVPNQETQFTPDSWEEAIEMKIQCLDKEDSQNTVTKVEDHLETTSLDTSTNDNDSAESDDEASFGTPEDSPKAKRKSPKGKYGKGKAPPPPKLEIPKDLEQSDNLLDSAVSTTSQESLNDIINMMPNRAFKETGEFSTAHQTVNPIAEKKRRHKSKSPGRIPKDHSSGLSKLLQLPNKFAFWHKGDDKTKSDGISTSSGDHSRRSSTIEKQATDDYQSCFDLNVDNTVENITAQADVSDDQNSFLDACDIDSGISQDIIEKSDTLQKLIEAKIESHPEYKYVSLHDDIPTTSKSTDV